jgi:hypothetical protein
LHFLGSLFLAPPPVKNANPFSNSVHQPNSNLPNLLSGNSSTEARATAELTGIFIIIYPMENLNSKACEIACLACAIECETCATELIAVNDASHLACINICRDCADICTLVARAEARASPHHGMLCALCIEACLACIVECTRIERHECCVKCAHACKVCITGCKSCASAMAA